MRVLQQIGLTLSREASRCKCSGIPRAAGARLLQSFKRDWDLVLTAGIEGSIL